MTYVRTHGESDAVRLLINYIHGTRGAESGTKRSCFDISAIMTPIYIIIAEFPMDSLTLWRRKLVAIQDRRTLSLSLFLSLSYSVKTTELFSI